MGKFGRARAVKRLTFSEKSTSESVEIKTGTQSLPGISQSNNVPHDHDIHLGDYQHWQQSNVLSHTLYQYCYCGDDYVMTVLLLYLCGISSVLYVLSHPTVMQGVFSSCLVALLAGLVCGGFSCRVVYCDSLQPGVQPPTPVSPRKYRIQSGHTFHLNYIMAIANGIATFFITLWWMLFR